MNYIHLIKKLNKTKYQNYFNSKKSFLKAYISNRKLLIKKLHKITYKDRSNLKNSKFKIKKFRYNNTYNDLTRICIKFNDKKILNKYEIKKIYSLYKKFETNLVLRECYNKNYLKISNKRANLNSYIFLGFLIKKLKQINSIQKINCIIKINDYLVINNHMPDNNYIKKKFLQNLNFELNYICNLNKS